MTVKTTIIPTKRQVIYDIYASFPTAGLEKGDLAWATDRLCLYRWNGNAWQSIGISSRNGDLANIGDPVDYPESSLYQADDYDRLYMVVSGAWQQISAEQGLAKWAAGDVLIISADTEKEQTSASYAEVKEIRIASGGIIRVKFDMKSGGDGKMVYGRIYKNGTPYGIERSNDTLGYQTFSEDLAFSQDDLVQVWAKKYSGTGGNCWIRNFRLYSDKVHLHQVELD